MWPNGVLKLSAAKADTSAARYCPLFIESDVLKLSSAFVLRDNILHDTILKARHVVHGHGTILILQLCHSVNYRQLVDMAASYKVSETDMYALLGFLNRIGALQRIRTFRKWPLAVGVIVRHLQLGTHYPLLSFRRQATPRAIALATLRATTPVLLAIGVVAAMGWVAGFAPLHTIVLIALGSQLTFLLSIYVHEIMHTIVLGQQQTPINILQIGMRLGLIHPALAPRYEIVSAIAGPLVGMLLSSGIGIWAWTYHLELLGCCDFLICSLHLGSLLPLYGDGASLTKAIRERKKHETCTSDRTY